jgi:MFS family permease
MESFRVHLGWSWPIPDEESSTVLEQQGWINACFTLGALVGAVPAGSIADAAGRRATVGAFALLMTLAASVEATSIGIVMMYVGRFLGGVAVGKGSLFAHRRRR